MNTHSLYLWAWAGSAFVATFVGAAALGCNVLTSVGIGSYRKILQYLAGAAGFMSLCAFCMKNEAVLTSIHATGNSLHKATWLISAFTASCVGLEAFGVRILKSFSLDSYRKVLQYIAGIAGAYSLYLYFGK